MSEQQKIGLWCPDCGKGYRRKAEVKPETYVGGGPWIQLEVFRIARTAPSCLSPFKPAFTLRLRYYQFDNKYCKLDNKRRRKSIYLYVCVCVLKTNSTRKRESCLHKTSEKQIKFGLSFSFFFFLLPHSKFSLCNTNFFLAITWRGVGHLGWRGTLWRLHEVNDLHKLGVALLGRCRIDYKRENEFRLCDEGQDEGSLTMFSLLFARTHCQSTGATRYAMISARNKRLVGRAVGLSVDSQLWSG